MWPSGLKVKMPSTYAFLELFDDLRIGKLLLVGVEVDLGQLAWQTRYPLFY